jgi:hypothetical protein
MKRIKDKTVERKTFPKTRDQNKRGGESQESK